MAEQAASPDTGAPGPQCVGSCCDACEFCNMAMCLLGSHGVLTTYHALLPYKHVSPDGDVTVLSCVQ